MRGLGLRYDRQDMIGLPRIVVVAVLSIAALGASAQYHPETVFRLPPGSSLMFFNSNGNKIKQVHHQDGLYNGFYTVDGAETMIVSMPDDLTSLMHLNKPNETDRASWFDRMRKVDKLIRDTLHDKPAPDDGLDHEETYEDGKLVNETYSDLAMKISIISDKSITVINLDDGVDLEEIANNKALLQRYRTYDGKKKCRSNKYDKAIIRSLRAGTISRPMFSKNFRFANPFRSEEQPSVQSSVQSIDEIAQQPPLVYDDEKLDKILPVLKPNFTHRAENFNHFRATWIGHSTMLIQINGLNILTDPMFSDTASPWPYYGPTRIRRPACTVDELPKIDLVLISHNHYDHLDVDSIVRINKRFGSRTRWLVPLGVGSFLKQYSISNYLEMDWWQKDCQRLPPVLFMADGTVLRQDPVNAPDEEQLQRLRKIAEQPLEFSARAAVRIIEDGGFNRNTTNEQIAIYFTPAQHAARRTSRDLNESLWGSFSIVSKDNATFFFSGATGYCSAFREIGDIFGPFAGAAIPIGSYRPRKYMGPSHLDPQEAIQVHRELRSKHSMAIHHSTFILSYEPFDEPANVLNVLMQELKNRSVALEPFNTVKHGETVLFCTSTCN